MADAEMEGTGEGNEDEDDDEAIANFLSDEMGGAMGTDVLNDFTDSNVLAELMEVVTSSLIPPPNIDDMKENQNASTSTGIQVSGTVEANEKIIQQESESNTLQRLKDQDGNNGTPSRTIETNKKNMKRAINLALHQKCFQRHRHNKFKDQCVPCCVILYDILNTEKFLAFVKPSQVKKSSGTSIQLCSISDRKVQEFHELENRYRQHYNKKAHQKVRKRNHEDDNDGKQPKKLTDSATRSNKVPDKNEKSDKGLNTGRSSHGSPQKDKRHKDIDKADEQKANNNGANKLIQESTTLKSQNSKPPQQEQYKRIEIRSSSSSNSSTLSEEVRKMRRRQKNDTKRERDRKFEKLERERHRKLSETRKYSSQHDKTQNASSFSPTKPAPMNFRIPKAEDALKKKCAEKPAEESKDNANNSSTVFGPTDTNKTRHKNKRRQNENKVDDGLSVTALKSEQPSISPLSQQASDRLLVKPQSIAEVVKVEADTKQMEKETVPEEEDMEDEGSVGGKTLPPVSEVRMGEFAILVTKLIKIKAKKDPTLQNFANACDPTTEKCAWWLSVCDKQPSNLVSAYYTALNAVPSTASDPASDISLIGSLSNSNLDDDCQVHEISSTSYGATAAVPDPERVNEHCGRSLLKARIRKLGTEDFQTIFDLRAGATYDKENFQAKCNLCSQLIVGRIELAQHVRSEKHKDSVIKLDSLMEERPPSVASVKTTTSNASNKTNGSSNPTKTEKKTGANDKRNSETNVCINPKSNRNQSKLENKRVKMEGGVQVEYGKTSTGLRVKIPLAEGEVTGSLKANELDSKSPTRSKRRSRSKSRSRSHERNASFKRTQSRSRSPVARIPRSPRRMDSRRSRSRSPDRYKRRHSRRSRSRSRSRSPRRRIRRSRSHSNERRSRRRSRSRSRSRKRSKSPILFKKDNREFHEKLILTAEGKWTDGMEKQWKLMEAEEAMFTEQFLELRRQYEAAPEDHPQYGTEWTRFWERRYQEVQEEGKDPDTYNYVDEWKAFWGKRLKIIFQEEADKKILEIKKKYKMDYESLSSVRKVQPPLIHPVAPIIPERSGTPLAPLPVPAPVPAPTSAAFYMKTDASGQAISTTGKKSSEAFKPPVSVKDFMSTWNTLTRNQKTSEMEPEPLMKNADGLFVPEFSVTTPFSQPQQAKTAAASDITSSSSDSSDMQKLDLHHLLHLMVTLEDHLSFFAPKVKEFYKTSEELELKKKKGAHILLENEELVTLLFQTRDRFMTMILSNVIQGESLRTANLTVFGLNAVLNTPQCQKFRPKVPILNDTEKSEIKREILDSRTEQPLRKKLDLGPTLPSNEDNEFSQIMASIPSALKSHIAGEITKYLLLMEGARMDDKKLKAFLHKLLIPIFKKKSGDDEEEAQGSASEKMKWSEDFDRKITSFDHHSSDIRIGGVIGSKTIGTALPSITKKRGSEPDSFRTQDIPRNEDFVYDPRGRREDGRTSPFSQRELASNPLADRY